MTTVINLEKLSLDDMASQSGAGFLHTVRVGADMACGMWGANLLLSRIAYTNPVTGTFASIMDVGCTIVGLGELGYAIWNREF